MTKKSGKHLHATYEALNNCFDLLGLIISCAHRDLHHWRSNQQPQYEEAETGPPVQATYKRCRINKSW